MKLFILFNGASGHLDPEAVRTTISEVLLGAAREHEFLRVERADALPQMAALAVRNAQQARGAVVVAGGDGTINAVAQQVCGSGVPLGVVPCGTFNYFARAHAIPLATDAAARALLDGAVRPVQVGRVNGRVFLVNASLGLYPTLLEDREAYKRQYGRNRLVALWAAVVTLLREHRQIAVFAEHDGEPTALRTPTLFVGNNPLQLEHVGVPEAASLQRGRLAALAARPVGTLALLGLALRGALGRLGESQNLIHFAFRRMTVRPAQRYGPQRFKAALDGEIVWMRAPLVFEIADEPLPLLVPAPPPQQQAGSIAASAVASAESG
ncbi:MAG TPA: diacylglycerol kinase family protein [Burkholderiaceae bacterium]|nr:diacylglycerol kinase family protein [Burkholderiaceae bacterium]